MVGGETEHLAIARPYIEAFSKKIVHAGPRCSGHALKAMNNTLNVGHLILGTEALLTLAKYGVKPEEALAAINSSSGRSLQTEVRIPTEVLTRRFAYGFKLDLMKKDVGIGKSILENKFPQAMLISHVAAIVDAASEVLDKDVDYTEVCRYLESLGRIELAQT